MSMAQSRINERTRSKGMRTHEDRNRGKATKLRQPPTHYEPAALLSGDQVTDNSEDREYTRTFEQTMLERMGEMREIIDTFAAIKDTNNKRGTNEESSVRKANEMMNKQAELIKKMNIKINNQPNDLGLY